MFLPMDFDQYINRVDALYSTLLEAGGQDASALRNGMETAHHALEHLPLLHSAELNDGQKKRVEALLVTYPQLPTESADHGERREWLQEARDFLIRL